MAKHTFQLSKEYIQLNQLLKVMGWAMTGGEANVIIDAGLVKVNGEIEWRRRNKIYSGFEVSYEDELVVVE
ncbi:RNA-binding S4 domain-containing protein [Chitinophagales bacterium]|jgi:ribosome-associated protein|nr:RNA-binding S4 domain-containing protein [Chitinophagales bacterium]